MERSSDRPIVSAWLTDLDHDWSLLEPHGRALSLGPEEPVFHEGESAEAVYVIRAGRVRLSTFAVDGRERHLLIVGARGMVGDCGLPSAPRHIVSAVSTSQVELVAIPTRTWLRLLESEPVIARQHAALSSRRFRVLLQQLELQAHNSARRRVCHHLIGLVNAYGTQVDGGVRIEMTYTQQEMGNICGLSRVSVSNIFSRLRKEGVVAQQRGHTVVSDMAQLRALALGEASDGRRLDTHRRPVKHLIDAARRDR